MKRRRPSNMRDNDLVLRAIQRERLREIAGGRLEPNCEREAFFQRSLLAGYRPQYADFIIPGLLFLYEQDEGGDDEAGGEASGEAPFTPSPEPAISRP